MNKKRLAAAFALILIVLVNLAVLILAFIDSPLARSCLMAALFGSIVVPAVLYGYLTLMGYFPKKREETEEPAQDEESWQRVLKEDGAGGDGRAEENGELSGAGGPKL